MSAGDAAALLALGAGLGIVAWELAWKLYHLFTKE